MKCKECRERIPDDVRYCPECGALIEANYYKNNHGAISHTKTDNKEKEFDLPFPKTKASTKSAPKKSTIVSIVSVIVMVVYIFSFVATNLIPDETYNEEIFAEEHLYPEYEQIAYDYACSILLDKDYDEFCKLSHFDINAIYSDINRFSESESLPISSEEISEFASEPDDASDKYARQAFEKTADKTAKMVSGDAIEYVMSIETYGSTPVSYDDIDEWYLSDMEDTLSFMSKSITDYNGMADHSDYTFYEVTIDICFGYMSSEYSYIATVCLCDYGDGIGVVYDDMFIRELLNGIYDEYSQNSGVNNF